MEIFTRSARKVPECSPSRRRAPSAGAYPRATLDQLLITAKSFSAPTVAVSHFNSTRTHIPPPRAIRLDGTSVFENSCGLVSQLNPGLQPVVGPDGSVHTVLSAYTPNGI